MMSNRAGCRDNTNYFAALATGFGSKSVIDDDGPGGRPDDADAGVDDDGDENNDGVR